MEETAAANEAPRHDGSETRRSASAGSFKSFVARRVLPRLPNAIARRIRRAYYLRLVRTSQPDQLPCRPVVEALVQTGDGVVDIGANIGVFTRYLADRVGPKGRVWAIEPVPETFDALAFNVRRLKLRNVEPIHCAVSDREGFVTMSIPRFHDGAENYYRAKIGETDRADAVRNVRVPVRS
ncbi:MAG: FkbM family methyltransferase, partial [Planctomycetota bacterium]